MHVAMIESKAKREKKYMGRIPSSQGMLQRSWKLEGRRGGGEFVHGGGGRRRKGTGRRRRCGAVGGDSLEEMGEREATEPVEGSAGHGGGRSCVAGGDLLQLGFPPWETYREEEQGARGRVLRGGGCLGTSPRP